MGCTAKNEAPGHPNDLIPHFLSTLPLASLSSGILPLIPSGCNNTSRQTVRPDPKPRSAFYPHTPPIVVPFLLAPWPSSPSSASRPLPARSSHTPGPWAKMADCPDSAFLTVTKAATKGTKSDRGEVDERAEREGYIKAWRQRFSDSLVPDRPSLVVFPTRASSSTTHTPVAATATATHTYIYTQAPTQTQKQSQAQAQAQAQAPAPAKTPPRPPSPSAPLPQATQYVVSSTAAPLVPSSFFRSGKAGHNTGAKGRDNEGQDKMTEDSLTYESEQEDIVAVFLKRLVDARVRPHTFG